MIASLYQQGSGSGCPLPDAYRVFAERPTLQLLAATSLTFAASNGRGEGRIRALVQTRSRARLCAVTPGLGPGPRRVRAAGMDAAIRSDGDVAQRPPTARVQHPLRRWRAR